MISYGAANEDAFDLTLGIIKIFTAIPINLASKKFNWGYYSVRRLFTGFAMAAFID